MPRLLKVIFYYMRVDDGLFSTRGILTQGDLSLKKMYD